MVVIYDVTDFPRALSQLYTGICTQRNFDQYVRVVGSVYWDTIFVLIVTFEMHRIMCFTSVEQKSRMNTILYLQLFLLF